MIEDLRGRRAVITGAGSGIGRGMACAFAAEGMDVAVCDIREDALAETVAAVQARGARAFPVQVDVSDSASVQRAAARGRVHPAVHAHSRYLSREILKSIDRHGARQQKRAQVAEEGCCGREVRSTR